jgi:hypothetical protein
MPVINNDVIEVDVRAQQLNVLDPQIGEQLGQHLPNNRLVYTGPNNHRCISVDELIIPTSLCLTTIFAMFFVIIYMTISQRKSKL